MNLPLAIGLFLLVLFLVRIVGIKFIKIPDIVLYILLGLGIAPFFQEAKAIEIAGEIGLVLLFFILGLKFSVNRITKDGKKVWKAGLLDVLFGIGVTTAICSFFGLDFLSSIIIGGLSYATSSSITAKLLEDKNRLKNPESEFMLSILIFEDLFAPILVSVLIGLSGKGLTVVEFLLIFIKITLLAAVAIFISKKIFKKFHFLLSELQKDDSFIVFIVGFALLYSGFAVYLGLSEVIGAFLAGIMLSDSPVSKRAGRYAVPIQNIFLPFFFVNFGMHIELTTDIPSLGLLITVLAWSIIFKIFIGYFGGQWFGLSKEDSLRAGLSLTQRGEFSVIIAGLAAGALQVFAGIYILAAALIGTMLFQFAPQLNKFLFKKLSN